MITAMQVWQVVMGLVVASYFLLTSVNILGASGCSDVCGVSSGIAEFISPPAFLLGAALVVSGRRLGRPTARGSRTTSLIIHWRHWRRSSPCPIRSKVQLSYDFTSERGWGFLLSGVGLCLTGFVIYAISLSRRARKYYGLGSHHG